MSKMHMGAQLPRLVDRMVESYLSDGRTQHIDKEFHLSRSAIRSIAQLLAELTYPGFIGRQGLTRHNISYHVGELLLRLWEQLSAQILQCLCYERERRGEDVATDECHRQAERIAGNFVGRLPDIRSLLADDVQAARDGDPSATSFEETILAYPGVQAVTLHRYAHELYLLEVPLLPRIMSEYAHELTGIDIHPGAQIGRSFFIDHGTGVVISETAIVGDNVKIYQGVTLGAVSFPKDQRGRLLRGQKRHPTVGNNVTIYAGATILGGQTMIGDGAVIGGTVFLTRSVPPGHRVSLTAPALDIRPPRSKTDNPLDWVI